MEELRKIIEESVPNHTPEANIIEALSKFNKDHEKCTEFVVGDNTVTKSSLLTSLINLLNQPNHATEVYFNTLMTIRYLCREKLALDTLAEFSSMETIFKKSALSNPLERLNEELLTNVEACKCFVNILMQLHSHPNTMNNFNQLRIPELLCDAIKEESLPKEFHFPLVRLLLQLIARDASVRKQVRGFNVFPAFAKLLLDYYANNCSADEEATVTAELLEVIFIVTEHLGPLEGSNPPSDEEFQLFKKLVPLFDDFLENLNLQNALERRIKMNIVKCLINVPAQCTFDFKQEQTLKNLLHILIFQINKTEDCNAAADLTPTLLNLHAISKAIPDARIIMKDTLLPGWRNYVPTNKSMEPPVELQDVNSVGAKLLKHMMSTNSGLNHYASELIFSLCDEDPDEFVRIVGVGTGAGILANRGLLASFMGGARVVNSPSARISEDDKKAWEESMKRLEKK